MKKYLLILIIFTVKVYSQDLSYNELNGIWKIKNDTKNYDTSINFGEYLKFIYNEIHFYKTDAGKEIETSVQKFYFLDLPENKIEYNGGQLIKFESGEIWELRLENKNNETRLIWELKKTKSGEYVISLDERRMIKNAEKRKKALEQEINTYCIKIE